MTLRSQRILFSLLAIVGVAVMSGCATKSEKDSTIPWSRPASWEGQAPGFGGFGAPAGVH